MTAVMLAAPGEGVLLAEKILAVVGGAVVGGLGLGLLAQLLARAFTTQKLPRWPLLTVRLLGAVLGGWLVALWVLGGGGPGIGGSGGWGFGSGSGKGEGEKTTPVVAKTKDDKKNEGDKETPRGETLRIEVLSRAALSPGDIAAERWYRLDTVGGPRLMALGQIKDAVKQRQGEQPPLRRIEIVLYKDSPDERVPLVSQLRSWAAELDDGKMKVDISQPDADAPTK